jgi:hypothetical protein
MKSVWMYTVASSNDPDNIIGHCQVPWQVDNDLIFFGPCKKSIREKLRRDYLVKSLSLGQDQLFIVGINGSNPEKIRKILWWGRVREVMTFYKAYDLFSNNVRFEKLMHHYASPMHVEPILDVDSHELIGYRHRSQQHSKKDEWISDLVQNVSHIEHSYEEIKLMPGYIFDRDCCMLLENRFFAQNEGIQIDDDAVKILHNVQEKKIDSYAVFGMSEGSLKQKSQAIGLRGTFLEIKDEHADQFIGWLEGKRSNVCSNERIVKHARKQTIKTCCS